MTTRYDRSIPSRPDSELQEAIKHMQSARDAATRGVDASSRAQITDAIASTRFFLAQAEKELKPPGSTSTRFDV